MSELRGLSEIVGSVETLHTIEPPPHPDDFEVEHDYRAAHEAWVRRSHWTFKRDTPTGTPDTAGHANSTRHDAAKEHST